MSEWQKAFVLHSRHYSESSILLDLFVESSGKITVLAKGARRKTSNLKGILQPFTPLIVQYSGTGEVKTLRRAESISLTLPLMGNALYSAFYLNELVHRVVVANNDTTSLFQSYLTCLQQLAQHVEPEKVLRYFELILLEHLGYGIDFLHCCATGEEIVAEMTYQYQNEKGFISSLIQNSTTYTGEQIIALATRHFDNKETLRAAKRFTRMVLKPYVGSKPFKSRELFFKV